MKKNKRVTIISKPAITECYTCSGEGSFLINENHPTVREKCTVCNGTGRYTDPHYLIIDNKNKMAWDSDNGG